jgi:AraC-like DNA-binding protein
MEQSTQNNSPVTTHPALAAQDMRVADASILTEARGLPAALSGRGDPRFAGAVWLTEGDLHFGPDGKHNPRFADDFPLQLRFYDFSRNARLTPSYHDYLEILCVLRSVGVFHVENADYRIQAGDVVVIGNTEFHRIEPLSEHVRVVVLYFMPDLIYRAGGSPLDFELLKPFLDHSVESRHTIPGHMPQAHQILLLLQRVHEELTRKGRCYRLAARNCLMEMLLVLARYYSRFAGHGRRYAQHKANLERLGRTFTFLRANYKRKILLKQVAEQAFMSVSYFCKFFKRVTGLTLTEYLTRMRIDKAKELLLRGDLSVTQVSAEVGFDNHSYFDKVFKRYNEMPPAEFRLRYGRNR